VARRNACVLFSVCIAVQWVKHTQIPSLLAYELDGAAPAKIIFMVILSFEVVLVSSPNIIIVSLKANKQV